MDSIFYQIHKFELAFSKKIIADHRVKYTEYKVSPLYAYRIIYDHKNKHNALALEYDGTFKEYQRIRLNVFAGFSIT